MERNTKEHENLRREITSQLKQFERNRQWADFSNWLHRLFEVLSPRKFPSLPQQLTLSKRLAQCLNPSLPAGVHSTALKVYQTILQNFSDRTELLACMALGLFPFFEHSNTQNKQTLLRLFEEYFICDIEGMQMIVGLTNALLTVLNENSEDLTRRVFNIWEKISRDYGRIWVDGAVWVNILKSPKVRLAGFKYFTKLFRDRDRAAQSQDKQLEEIDKVEVGMIQKRIQESKLREEEKVLLTSLYGYKSRPDDPSNRFPNFSSLVVNALQVCLEISTDNMIKRAALDLLGGYLRLNSGVFGRRQGVIIMEKMLLLLQSKEYSLTNRVYKYLFDQPNSEGYFAIDPIKKSYELDVLREALGNLLVPKTQKQKSTEDVFVIIQILIVDHPALAQYLLESLAFKIVSFAQHIQNQHRKEKALSKAVSDFYLNVVMLHRRRFIGAIVKNMLRVNLNDIDPLAPKFTSILEVLKFYFNRMEKIVGKSVRKQSGNNLEEVEEKKNDQAKQNIQYLSIRVETLKELIEYLWVRRPLEQSLSLSVLDLCNDLLAEIQIACDTKEEGISSSQLDQIMSLLQQEASLKRKNLYSKLLTLLPKPNKELLLPYIEDSSLSIVCINLLLGGQKVSKQPLKQRTVQTGTTSIVRSGSNSLVRSRNGSIFQTFNQPLNLTHQQQKQVFFAIFKLLNCHLFEVRALEFADRFRNWWGDVFSELIDKVEPSQWFIYWRKKNGQVAGGILRMIQNLECNNSYHHHLSKKWITEAQSIISKVLQAVFGLLQVQNKRKDSADQQGSVQFRQWNIVQYQRVYNLLKLIFRFTTAGFTTFFFLQKDKFLAPFVLYFFKCLEDPSFVIKSKSIAMLTFILNQTQNSQQIVDFVLLTQANALAILDSTITRKKELESKMIDSERIGDEKRQGNEKEEFKLDCRSQKNEELLLSNLQIQLLQYLNLTIKKVSSITQDEKRLQEQIIIGIKNCNLYAIIFKGIVFTETHYIKKFYIQTSKQLAAMLAKIDKSKQEITSFLAHILDKLFILLKNCEVNKIQQIIKSRNQTGAKQSILKKKGSINQEPLEVFVSIAKETVLQTEIKQNLNLQEKYAEVIELWNTVKYYLNFSVKMEIKELPITNLLSLVLTSFPLSYLKYTTVGQSEHVSNLQSLQEQLANVTGLKKQVFQIFQLLWNKQSKQILDFLIEKSDPRILIHCQLEPNRVLETFMKNTKFRQVARKISHNKLNLPKNMLYYNGQYLQKQNQILFFLYVYLLYCNFKLFKSNKTKIKAFLDYLVEILQVMKLSSHIQTKLWLLQILELIGQKIVGNKDVNVENWHKTRGELQHLTKELLDQVLSVISKSKYFTHKTEVKTGIFTLFNKEEKQVYLYDFIKVFPPTISSHFQKYKQYTKRALEFKKKLLGGQNGLGRKKSNNEQPRERLASYLQEQQSIILQKQNKINEFLFSKFINRQENQYADYLSLCGLYTLIRIGNNLLINIYEKDFNKVSLIIKQILLNLLPLCEKKENSNELIIQLIAQYLETVMNNQVIRPEILKSLKKNIIEVFMADEFFNCTQKTLAHWRTTIDYCSDSHDLLNDLLSKEGLFQGIFTRKAEVIRQKIKSFQRVCFVIYAGKVDKYQNKLRTVLQSLNEVMKQQDASPALLILILFCIRILLMRLSAISLNKLFRSVWPSLITLFIQIFRNDKAQKNINLQLAGLKAIELIHALDLEEFMLHKWMFIFDYFGLKIDPMGQIQDNMKECQMLSPFRFKPFMTNSLPNNRLKCKFMPEKLDIDKINNSIIRRKFIIKLSFVEHEEELKQYGLMLMQYMMDLNECRAQISKEDIQNLIEDDFITLDGYIYKMK